jgi:enoyl-CoA hydratase/carnithine racemase
MPKTAYGDVSLLLEQHVALLEIHRPPHNYFDVQLFRDLAEAFRDLENEPACRAVVLASEGKSFCAGTNFGTAVEVEGPGPSRAEMIYSAGVELFAFPKPIVAAIQGPAIGGGLGLALVADFRVVSPEARFAANFVKLGFHPGFGITYTLPRLVGAQRAALMCLTGRRIKGEEALAWGLVDEIAPLQKLRDAALTLAREIAENAPLAVQATRATLRDELAAKVKAQTDVELIKQTALRKTADYAEGVRAVAERRAGDFIGA